MRKPGTTTTGEEFDSATEQAVWEKGRAIQGFNPDSFRYDMCGAVMVRSGINVFKPDGWEIDHIIPVARGGTDDLSNLQPLTVEHNRMKGNQHPWGGPE
jgi:hypothetical protein